MSTEDRKPLAVTLVFGLCSAADDRLADRPYSDLVSALAAEVVDVRPGASLPLREALVESAVRIVAEAGPDEPAMVDVAGVFVTGWLGEKVVAGG